ncbi:MAG: hypothetical protein N2Z21_01205 [Candidatus Sumerlaeaceae bacterium]|nr:hypothetical protein [Candidatus Sumerlaeaceae bacterium]
MGTNGSSAPVVLDKTTAVRRSTKGALILVFWLVMMLALVYRQNQKSAPRAADAMLDPKKIAAKWKDSSEYAVILAGDSIIGGLVTTMTREIHVYPAYLVHAFAAARLGGRSLPLLQVNLKARLDQRFHLRDFAAAADLPTGCLHIVGRIRFPELWLEVRSSNAVRRGRFRLENPIALADAFRSVYLQSSDIRPGVKLSFDAVDPLWNMRLGRVEMEIGALEEISLRGRIERAFSVTTRYGDLISRGWVDSSGRLVRQQILGALTLERATETEVAAWLQGDDVCSVSQELDERAFRDLAVQPFRPQSVLSLGDE